MPTTREVYSFSVGSTVYSFSLTEDDSEVKKIIRKWKMEKTYKKDIKKAIILYELQKNPKEFMTAYLQQPSALALLPPAWDLWRQSDIASLSTEDLLRLFKVMLENSELVRRQIEDVNSMK